MRKLLIVAALSLTLSAQAETVCSNHDGDTLTLCNGAKVRLWGVDSPEYAQPLGREAQAFTAMVTRGRDVQLTCQRRKSYKRLVCSVQVSTNSRQLDLEKELLGWGYAYHYRKYTNGLRAMELDQAEAFAMQQRRGVWALPYGGERPWVWRHRKH